MPTPKGPLIVERRDAEEAEEDTWTVYPTEGICIKFREAHFPASSHISGPSSAKFFINLAHCTELPPPQRHAELGEEAVAKLLADDPDAFRIPICVGELDRSAEDNNGETVSKVDVLLNSEFFHKRISESEFFRQLTIRIICEAIEAKHSVRVDIGRQIILRNKKCIAHSSPNSSVQLTIRIICEAIEAKHSVRVDIGRQIILRNKKCIGTLCVQRIRKSPTTAAAVASSTNGRHGLGRSHVTAVGGGDTAEEEGEGGEEDRMDIDSIEQGEEEKRRPRNFKVQIVDGQCVDVRVRTRDQRGELVTELERITLKMNNDRIVVIVDGCCTCADFFLPVRLNDQKTEASFDSDAATLRVKCLIEWN
uniref:PIH1 domain-containing protein n=1 Tax=Globodera pallida TaxID=36090 RepID=A0A183BSR2_GLOPA